MDSGDGPDPKCWMKSSINAITYAMSAFIMFGLIMASRMLHVGLRRLRQPRIVSEFIVGVAVGNMASTGGFLQEGTLNTLYFFAKMTTAAYMFINGVEMDARHIFRRPTREAAVAYASTLSSFLLLLSLHRPLIRQELLSTPILSLGVSPVIICLLLSNTSSSVLTRLTTELKIGKSDIGRLTVGAGIHVDMITVLLLCVFSAAAQRKSGIIVRDSDDEDSSVAWLFLRLLLSALQLAVQGYLVFNAAPPLLDWIDKRNPEGRRIKGLDLTIALLFIGGLCVVFNKLFFFDVGATAFLVGLFLPREGRISSFLIRNFNFYITAVGLPLYLCSAGLTTDLGAWVGTTVITPSRTVTWTWGSSFGMLVGLFFVNAAGKVAGTLFAALRYGCRLSEALALGLLLNVKGHLHIFCTIAARDNKVITQHAALVMLMLVVSSIVFVPLIVAGIVWSARRRAKDRTMGLQWHDPTAELRLVAGIYGPQDVPAMINLIEATRGNAQAPITIYAMDLVELTERTDAALVHGHTGLDAVAINDDEIKETSRAITQAFEAYAEDAGAEECAVTVKRFLAVSFFSNMHVDICNLAQDTLSVLVLVPFHRRQRVDGAMDHGNSGFRQVNEKVLKHAPCTVGILVDRGLGAGPQTSASYAARQVAVIFVGGKDDREALLYGCIMSQHPGVHVTAIKFLFNSSLPAGQDAMEQHLDEQCFAEFYDGYVATGGVGYVEKFVSNAAEMVAVLRALEQLYELFLVGRGGERSKSLMAGMSDWAECPELGPIGDVLASSDVSVSASVLIIQQHSIKRHIFPEALDPVFD